MSSRTCSVCKIDEAVKVLSSGDFGREIEVCVRCWLKNRQVKSGITSRYLCARVGHFKDAVRSRLQEMGDGKSGFIWGSFGIGKTYALMSAATHRIMKFNKSTRVITWGDLGRGWRSCFKNKSQSEEDFFKDLVEAEALFIDDIGDKMGDESHGIKAMFCDLIDRRYSNNLHTVMTSNLSLTEIAEAFSPKLTGRIRETCAVIEFSGKDKRQPEVVEK